MMKEKINQYLHQLEQEEGIKILLACETGSRAWGFPSPDSDYDIRVIYLHPEAWYLGLTERKDSIERMFENNDLDISGWDLRKSLRLLKRSNPSLLERLQSPIVYRADEAFAAEMLELSNQFYSKIATMYHYLSMAKKIFEEVNSKKEYKLKKFFYALRSSIACKWILEMNVMPPIEFSIMLHHLAIPQALKIRILELIELKAHCNESYFHTGESDLLQFVETTLDAAEKEAHNLPVAKGDWETLNRFFIKTLKSK